MPNLWRDGVFLGVAVMIVSAASPRCHGQQTAPLPRGVRAVWDLDKAHREATATRERVCLNGLWRWQPADEASNRVPSGRWGFFKVPGCWPGITNYMQKDCQFVHPHASWKSKNLRGISMAWYQREMTVPAGWKGRRIAVALAYLNSFATVFVDGKKAGDIRFPDGEADVTSLCRPGNKHLLSILTVAMPLKGVMMSFNDTSSARKVKGSVARRGLCGDVWLVGTPKGTRISNVKIDPSVRKWNITFHADLDKAAAGKSYSLRAEIVDGGKTVKVFTSKPFTSADLNAGRYSFTQPWKPEKLWDTHTPQNQFVARLSLLEGGKALDVFRPVRFGFRELWIDGRDFYLNGTRIHLSAVPLDNAQVGAAQSTYEAATESLARLRTLGINFVYTHNYGCTPGSHLGFEEILRAADDFGMLVAISQPHCGHYDWEAPDADRKNGYERHAAFYVRVAQHHPSVVFYDTSHNATGDSWDMDPDAMGRDYAAKVTGRWSLNNRKKALRAETIIRRLDPSRVVYHHSSGSFGVIHSSNFYPNWAPIQEMSDWLEGWSKEGVKPVFLCEYGTPFSWDWAMYRGWYPAKPPPKGKRAFGSARVPWAFCLAEWNAQFFGDRAFNISEAEKRNLRWEAKKVRAGQVWHRWDYPHHLGSRDFPERDPVFAAYFKDNYRAFRTWGLSANSPWEHRLLLKPRTGLNRNARKELKTDWENLQRPGFSPDYLASRYERFDTAYERKDWVATPAAQALIQNNGPVLAYIAGKQGMFTSKDHNFLPGETVEKQIVVINNSRRTVTCAYSWSLALPTARNGSKTVSVATGRQAQIPLRFALPTTLKPGEYKLSMKARFSDGAVQEDAFAIHVMADAPAAKPGGRIALFDPRGETKELLAGIGVKAAVVTAGSDLSAYSLLIVGKNALSTDGPAPKIQAVRKGLKVLMFEQTADVLEKRFGFRIAEYGLRQVFKRVPDHPILAGVETHNLRDWRGKATLIPPRLKSTKSRALNYGFVFSWCGLPTTRVFRCGNRGSVASVLIERPAGGDFLSIVEGGFSLQYSTLLEYREGKGMVLFCQMDVTGRTESDPSAERIAKNILAYANAWKPAARKKALYAGDAAGRAHLQRAGFAVDDYATGAPAPGRVLVVGPGGGKKLAPHKAALAAWFKKGGQAVAIGLTPKDTSAFLPFSVKMKTGEHISTYFPAPTSRSPLAGIGPADVHNRDPRKIPLLSGNVDVLGNGVLGVSKDGRVAFCQLAPWRFDYQRFANQKRTYRRISTAVSRMLGNMGVACKTPLLERFSAPPKPNERRWLQGFYLDTPVAYDDPYRFFRW